MWQAKQIPRFPARPGALTLTGHLVVLGGLILAASGRVEAQAPVPPKAEKAPGIPPAARDQEKPKGSTTTVSAASGPIKVEKTVGDDAIQETLDSLLEQYPGVRSIRASVKDGVVKLDGQVDDDDTRTELTNVAKQVEGVRVVVNRLATDDESMTAPGLVLRKLESIWDVVSRRWLLGLLAFAIFLIFSGFARVSRNYSETLLAPFLKNPMIRSVVGSIISTLLLIGGLILALSVLNLTHAVASVLGVAGVVGLAVGFAFKDIAENFIASLLLGIRRPFQVGDYVTVAGQSGVVRSLNTRATVLVTLEGNHVRIPNNVIFKEILVNSTASPTYRVNFDVVIPYDASTSEATEAMTRALRAVDGVDRENPARALVEALEPGGVRVRAYYWVPVRGVDWLKLNSDTKLAVKVALQKAGILGSPTQPAPAAATNGKASASNEKDECALRAETNLNRDAHAASTARAVAPEGHPTPIERVLEQSETRVSEEGTNLLAGAGKANG